MASLSLFANERDTRKFSSGEIIFVEGDAGDEMFVVLDGAVRLSVTGRTVEKVVKGGVFGEMAIIDAEPRSATATAITDCTLASVTAQRFRALLAESPDFGLEIMRVLAARLRSMDRKL